MREELLAVMLGMKEQPVIRWYVGIVRAPTPLRRGRFRVAFTPAQHAKQSK